MPPPAIHFTFSLCSLLSVLFSTLIRLNFGLSCVRTSSIYFSLSDLFHLTSTFQFSACCWKDGISFFFWQQNFIEYRQQLLFTDLSVDWILSLAIVNKAMINSTRVDVSSLAQIYYYGLLLILKLFSSSIEMTTMFFLISSDIR